MIYTGMWGRATYFAHNASYSNNGYAFTVPPDPNSNSNAKINLKQIFLARVVLGKTAFIHLFLY